MNDVARAPAPSYLATAGRGRLREWLVTTDHKRIGVLYLVSVVAFFALGALAMALIRLELMTPASDLVSLEGYNRLFTLHGVVMVWFFLIPSIPTTLGNFLIPLLVGARDLAFPRLNLLSWYLFVAGGLLTVGSLVAGGVDTGWTFYTPFSTAFSNSAILPVLVGVFVAGFSTILTGLNFMVTIHTMRAPGIGWWRLRLLGWSLYATSAIQVLATPVLGMTLLLIALERVWGPGIIDPARGGDPVLFQHLFWFYSHPAVYIMILPAMGVVSEIIPCFARRPIFGYRAVAISSLGIALLGFLVWGHHMFVSGQSVHAGLVFSLLSFLVAVPSAIKVFNWTATLHMGWIQLTTPMVYALGFVGIFTIGGLSGLFLAAAAIDVHVHDTWFVVAHFHYIMVGGAVLGFLGGLHFWWPKITGRLYSEPWGLAASILAFFGFNLTFAPQFFLGWLGMPRRVGSYDPAHQALNVLSSAGASILGVAYLLPLVYLTWSCFRGAPAPANPWDARGLEWTLPSPPPPGNFAQVPTVTEPPYAYPTPGVVQPGVA